MKLKDMKVSKRAYIGFGILELLMVVLVIAAITATKGVNSRLEQIVKTNDTLITAAYDVKDADNTVEVVLLARFTSKKDADVQALRPAE